ncbi:genetic competence negative regulator [Ammoniphilus sp. CFH 90114]|uniref:genetic competence negative regulator n=1 Tax=Ammoniphilus sp. CFH 90114 TaxID=2493665 RepID=UPI00100EBD1D|nr:genetic competence negative regulator [Ammoniphilus sp. CFH 90114]RXT13875.1 genetic competence negative regulator [Ammoniphilus sp. CFH 90114]
MRVERLSQDKIRIFLTFDDLHERGIEKEDIWRDIPKVHDLFNDMMEHAYQELGFEVMGPVAVEVFALPAQGMVVIVTRGRSQASTEDDADYDDDDIYEMEVTLEESEDIIFYFHDFEHLLEACHRTLSVLSEGGKVYSYNNRYYLVLDDIDMENQQLYHIIIALLSEYGEASTVTKYVLAEYGKTLVPENAIQVLCEHFK